MRASSPSRPVTDPQTTNCRAAEHRALRRELAGRETPFVLAERTGGGFSGTIVLLSYRYLPHVRPLDLPALRRGCAVRRRQVRSRAGRRTFLAKPVHIQKGAAMTQGDHYRDQSDRARQLAEAIKDPEASKKLIERTGPSRLKQSGFKYAF